MDGDWIYWYLEMSLKSYSLMGNNIFELLGMLDFWFFCK